MDWQAIRKDFVRDMKFKLFAYSAATFGVPLAVLVVLTQVNFMCMVGMSLGLLPPVIHQAVN